MNHEGSLKAFESLHVHASDEQLSEGESILRISDKITAFISSWQMVAMILVFVFMALGSINR